MVSKLSVTNDMLATFCRQHKIRKLAFFGSVLRRDFTDKSDVDVLVEFKKDTDCNLTYFQLAKVQMGLQQLLNRPVDLALANALDKHLKEHILETAQVQYDEI